MDMTDSDALHLLAKLMDEDDARTGRVGIPVSHGHFLLWEALAGPRDAWDREYAHLCRTEGSTAASAWSNRLEAQYRRLVDLVYPGGATAHSVSADTVRALATDDQGTENRPWT